MRSAHVTMMMVGVLSVILAGVLQAATIRTEAGKLQFPSSEATAFSGGFTYQGQSGDLAVDSAGNAHIVNGNQANHTGNIEYRRWDPAIGNWAGGVVSLGSGGGTFDIQHTYITVDDADRVHIIYQHRIEPDPWSWYHAYADNATGSNPLSAANWTVNELSGIPLGTTASTMGGSVVSVGADTLVLAQYESSTSGIRLDKAEWDGSAWNWNTVGTVFTPVSGSIRAPNLSYEAGVLHMSLYSNEINGQRGLHYSQSLSPTDPTAGTWIAREPVLGPTGYTETKGGVGILPDGSGIALVWGANNRDNFTPGVTEANFSRERDVNGTWSAWEEVFPGDLRQMPSGGVQSWVQMAFAPDSQGGLFSVYDNQYISHWDSETGTWMDVFTNVGTATANKTNLGVYINDIMEPSYVYHYNHGANIMTLYVGEFMIVPEPGTALIFILGGLALLRRSRGRRR